MTAAGGEFELPASDEALLAECDVETFRAGGPGGQHQNVTDSAVRLRHRPTGIVVTCRAQRSQYQNKQTCLRRLREKAAKLNERAAPRVQTRPSRAAKERRLDEKARRGRVKRDRAAPAPDD